MKTLFFFIALGSAFLFGCNKNDSSKIITHNFPKQQWIGGLVNTISSLKLHLNNYTATKHEYEQDDDYAYEHPKSSSISIGNTSIPFDIPVTRSEPYSMYINDVNSGRLGTDAHDGYGYVTIYFESYKTEIVGDCVNNLACGLCGGAPQLDLSNIKALLPIAFTAKDGSAAIASAPGATFTSDISESGPCVNNACAFMCDILAPDKNSDMQKTVATVMEDYIDQYSSVISIPFNQYLQKLGVTGSIVSIQIAANGDLKVEDKE